VQVVQVDDVGAQVGPGSIDGAPGVLGAAVLADEAAVLGEVGAPFGGEDDLVTTGPQCAGDELFVLEWPVGFGVSIRVMPRSTARLRVAMDSVSSRAP
jgi:hypothetical protein